MPNVFGQKLEKKRSKTEKVNITIGFDIFGIVKSSIQHGGIRTFLPHGIFFLDLGVLGHFGLLGYLLEGIKTFLPPAIFLDLGVLGHLGLKIRQEKLTKI